jgi:hypothetical protein
LKVSKFVSHVSYEEWFGTRRRLSPLVQLKQDGLKLDGTQKILVYAEDGNVLGGILILQWKTQTLL